MLNQKLKLEFVFAASLAIAICGCDSDSPQSLVEKANKTNIQKLANFYNQYQSTNSFVGPDSAETLRDYIENDVPDFIKERIKMAPGDDIFVSERDGKPFKIKFEVVGSGRGCTKPAIFEAEGVNGKFNVGFLNMITREVDKEEYDKLWDENGS